MKKAITIFCVAILFASVSHSQTEVWKMQDTSVGQSLSSFPGLFTSSSPTMSEVIMLPDSTYRMYVNVQQSGGYRHCIGYANSVDAINFTYVDTCFCGSTDTLDRTYVTGGPSVVQLTSGQYRMYYRSTQKIVSGPKMYHVRSAISSDGITFTQEGIRIEIQPYDVSSGFTLVGHGTYWETDAGTFAGIFSGNPDTSAAGAASSLIFTTSVDGLTWGGFQFLYYGCHDPIVVKKGGQYHLYGMDQVNYMMTAKSADGLIWPATADSASFLDLSDNPMIVGGTKKIGDVGGCVMPWGELYLYTNFGTTTGPSLDIIRFTRSVVGIDENEKLMRLNFYPNPAITDVVIDLSWSANNEEDLTEVIVTDLFGKIFNCPLDFISEGLRLDISTLSAGIYFVTLVSADAGSISGKMIVE